MGNFNNRNQNDRINFTPDYDVIVYKVGTRCYAQDRQGNDVLAARSGSDRVMIAGAINSLTSGRTSVETVYVAPGTYTFDQYITPVSYTRIVNDGYWQLAAGADSQLVWGAKTDARITQFYMERGTYDGNGANQAAQTNSIVTVAADTLDQVYLRDLYVLNAYRGGIKMEEDNAVGEYKEISGCKVYNVAVGTTSYGIYVDFCDNTHILNNYVQNVAATDGIELGNGRYICKGNIMNNCPINFPFASHSIIEDNILSGVRGNIQNDANTADHVTVKNNHILGSTPASGYGGISVYGDYAVIEGNDITVNEEAGIYSKSGTAGVMNHVIKNNIVATARASVTASEPGIRCNRGANTVSGNQIYGKWKYGIQLVWDNDVVQDNIMMDGLIDSCIYCTPFAVSAHNIANGIIRNNQLAFVTIGITGTLTSMKINDNYGFVTENKGTSTIANGNTNSGNIAHGLGYTPTAAEFTINFTEDPTNSAGTIWLSGIDGTNFVVNCENDPGASGLDFSWAVRRLV